MIRSIAAAIAACLTELFGEDMPVHIGEAPQSFDTPCFFILPFASSQKQIAGDRYYREHHFHLRYFPRQDGQMSSEIGETAERLWMGLEYVDLSDGPIRGTAMRQEVRDNVLHFHVNYNCFVLKERARGPLMQRLRQKQKVGNEEVEGNGSS